MERVPPFSALIAFDAVVTAGSVTKGAERLNVTQPAISRRIAVIEQDLGVRLFDRSTKPHRLTAAGLQLHQALRDGLARIEGAVAELRLLGRQRTITISTGSGFASFWLTPRLGALQAAFPGLDLRLLSGDGPWSWSEVDLRIEFGGGHWADADARMILGEEVFAVSSPGLLAASGRSGLAALDGMTLLDIHDPALRWYSWRSWFAAAGHQPGAPPRTIQFDNYALLIASAVAGQGAALCWAGLLDPLIETGALVRVSADTVRSDRGYHVLVPASLPADAPARGVAAWLADNRP